MTRIRIIAMAFALAVGWGTAPARADFLATLTVAVTPESGGWHRYDYTVTVDATSTLPLVQFDLMVAADADLQGIGTPVGWSFDYDASAGAISFFAEAIDAPIGPGSAAGFAFVSRLAPVEMEYYLTGVDPPGFGVIEGRIAAPGAAIPEPSSLALGLVAAAGMALAGLRRR